MSKVLSLFLCFFASTSNLVMHCAVGVSESIDFNRMLFCSVMCIQVSLDVSIALFRRAR